MTRKCAVLKCPSKKASVGETVSYHQFPLKNKALLELWLRHFPRENFEIKNHHVLCSLHFEEGLVSEKKGRKILTPNAVPTLFDFEGVETSKLSEKLKWLQNNASEITTIQDIHDGPSTASAAIECRPNDKTTSTSEPMECESPFPFTPKLHHSYCKNYESPDKPRLKRKLNHLREKHVTVRRKLKTQTAKCIRQKAKIDSLKQTIQQLQLNGLDSEQGADIIENCFDGVLKDLLLTHLKVKDHGHAKGLTYPDSVRQFCQVLHFYSPRAYQYLKAIITLPHVTSLRNWASHIDGKPGFTEQSFLMVKKEMEKLKGPLLVSLMMDEIAIRKRVEWDGKENVGYCDFGHGVFNDDNMPIENEALVFMGAQCCT